LDTGVMVGAIINFEMRSSTDVHVPQWAYQIFSGSY